MYVKCWNCSTEIDTLSVEQVIYEQMIESLRGLMCSGSVNDYCDLWWRHEGCDYVQGIIAELKEKLP
jgi:coenzyme F420-reducing hydrogenase delta subunit